MESRRSSVAKAVIWTALGLVIMALVGFAFTGSVQTGGLTAIINSCIGLVAYVLYERVWAQIAWGRNAPQ